MITTKLAETESNEGEGPVPELWEFGIRNPALIYGGSTVGASTEVEEAGGDSGDPGHHCCQIDLLPSLVDQAVDFLPYLPGLSYSAPCNCDFQTGIVTINSLYEGLHLNLIQKLQLAQNVVACMLLTMSLQVCIQPVLCQLNWLPIVWWICFKIMVLLFKAHYGQEPAYFQEDFFLFVPHSASSSITQHPLTFLAQSSPICLALTRVRVFSALDPT